MVERLLLTIFEGMGIMLFVFYASFGAPLFAAILLYLLDIESVMLFIILEVIFLAPGVKVWRFFAKNDSSLHCLDP